MDFWSSPATNFMALEEPQMSPRTGASDEPMHTLPIKCQSVSRSATCASTSIPHTKYMYFTRVIEAIIVFLITCIVQARLSRIIEMNKTSNLVPKALAPPIPITDKQE